MRYYPNIRVVDNNKMKNRPWRVNWWGDLLINENYVNQFEADYDNALEVFYHGAFPRRPCPTLLARLHLGWVYVLTYNVNNWKRRLVKNGTR